MLVPTVSTWLVLVTSTGENAQTTLPFLRYETEQPSNRHRVDSSNVPLPQLLQPAARSSPGTLKTF